MEVRERRRISKQTARLILYIELFVLDLVIVLATPAMVGMLLSLFGPSRYDPLPSLLLLPIYAVVAINSGAYTLDVLRRSGEGVRRAITSFMLSVFTILLVIFFFKSADNVSRLSIGLGTLATVLMLGMARVAFGRHVRQATEGQLINELVIIDDAPAPENMGTAQVVSARQLHLEPDLNNPEMLHRFGALAKSFDRILIASAPERQVKWALLLKGADIDGDILMDQANDVGAIGVGNFCGTETMQVSRKPLSVPDRAKKRLLDLSITVPLLIVLLPLLAVVALAVKLDSPGPILFKQDRVGRGNRLFKVLKFRSMRAELGDARGSRSASRDDDRITRSGRFIRATSIDELPQLLNVLIGDMSLVGPRPHALGSLAGERLFWEVDQTYWHRHQLKPGITGLAQIRGHRGATLQMSDLTDRLQADMEYVQGWDIWRDISILFNTFRVVVHKNAF
jgi:exopolysaccharide biosynthesis polyprenyl glycosylphosphotransferase